MTIPTPDAQLIQVQDAAWRLKDVCDDIMLRPLSDSDKATLASVERDLVRLRDRLVEMRDRRRRRRNGAANAQAAEDDAGQQALTAEQEA